MRRALPGTAAAIAGISLLTVAPAWADPIPDTLTYDFAWAGCDTSSDIAEAFLYTHLERATATTDNDNDVNIGDVILTSLRADGTDGEVDVEGVETTFVIRTGTQSVITDFSIPAGSTEQFVLAEANPYTVTAADAGLIIELGVTRVDDPSVAEGCYIPFELGTHALYVNRPPALLGDEASTTRGVPVSIPILDNDDVTWDSGVIDAVQVSEATAAATQDDLAQMPADQIAAHVAIAVDSPHGSCSIQPDGSLLFTPLPDFEGRTYCNYGVVDNDGAYAGALVAIDVLPAAIGEPDPGGLPPTGGSFWTPSLGILLILSGIALVVQRRQRLANGQ